MIPEGVSNIGEGAFSGGAVKEVEIPDSVVTLGSSAFAHCAYIEGCLSDAAFPK